tara:strand:+ start:599 stop:784 length:186 start_codon:yes stop_codon:yes gene_type:complete
MKEKKYKRKQSLKKTHLAIEKIKKSIPAIIFKAKNIVVTLKSKSQLKRWLDLYPEGKYTIN